jgi:hypothetical protein
VFRELDRSAQRGWAEYDDDGMVLDDGAWVPTSWDQLAFADRPPVERDRTSRECPECGRKCVGVSGLKQHRKDKHGVPKAA